MRPRAHWLGFLLLLGGAAQAKGPLQLTVQTEKRTYRYDGATSEDPELGFVATLRNASDHPVDVSLSPALFCGETVKWNGRSVKRQVHRGELNCFNAGPRAEGFERTLAPRETVQVEFLGPGVIDPTTRHGNIPFRGLGAIRSGFSTSTMRRARLGYSPFPTR
jgi:hypothetical protein